MGYNEEELITTNARIKELAPLVEEYFGLLTLRKNLQRNHEISLVEKGVKASCLSKEIFPDNKVLQRISLKFILQNNLEDEDVQEVRRMFYGDKHL